MRLLWLADCLRASGLEVVETTGWKERGADLPGLCSVVIGHHTATPRTAANAGQDIPTLGLLIRGRSDLAGPLCQLGLGRSGTYYVVAAGKANHAGKGHWAGVVNSRRTIGIEAEHPGIGGWPEAQLAAYDLGVAAVLRQLDQDARRYAGHREWAVPAGRKVDPGGLECAQQRVRVDAQLATMSGAPRSLALLDEELTMDETTLRRIIQEEVREEIRTVLGDITGPDADMTHYALNDVRLDLKEIKTKLGL